MKKYIINMIRIIVPILMVLTQIVFGETTKEQVGISLWRTEDEIGTLECRCS